VKSQNEYLTELKKIKKKGSEKIIDNILKNEQIEEGKREEFKEEIKRIKKCEKKEGIEKTQKSKSNNTKNEVYQSIVKNIKNEERRKIFWKIIELIKLRDSEIVYEKIIDNIQNIESKREKIVKNIRKIKLALHDEIYRTKMLYTQLRLKYEDLGRYHEAGDFFIGEMEMRRKGKNFEKRIIRGLLYIYGIISKYGERPLRAFCYFISIPVIFTFIYFFSGLKNTPRMDVKYINYDVSWNFPFLDISFWKDFFNTLFFSIHNAVLGRTFTTLMPEGIISTAFSIFENIIGIIFLSLFLLAMNRKFRRTKDKD
jgi:hypothetical protein